MLVLAGRADDARAEYRKSLDIYEKLVAADPDNALWQTDLVVALVRLALTGDEPRPRLERALEIMRRLEREGKLAASQRPGSN